MALPSIFNSMNSIMKTVQTEEILQTNVISGEYGLALTAKEAEEIIEVRNLLLRGYGRVELDMESSRKLICSLSSSFFISQEEYSTVIKELQEVFYYMKNETGDEIGDERIIEIIMDMFNINCGGSVELLKGRELEVFIRDYRLKRYMIE